METDELIGVVLDYPFLMDIYAYDTYQKGFKAVSERFNGLKELMQRKDSATKLLSKYKNMTVAKDVKKVTSKQIFDLSNIEVILRQDEILTKFNNVEINEMEKEVENKYLKKKENKQIYGLTVATSYIAQAEIQDSFVKAQATLYVYTPKGTAVEVFIRGELLTAPEKIAMDNYVRDNYPGASVVRTATTNYNCHSYAWYSTSSTNKYWMNYPNAYMTDGSYKKRTGEITDNALNDKVYYNTRGNEHSGTVYAQTRGNSPYVISKWGAFGLVKHYYSVCPYYVSPYAIEFYYR